MKNFIEFMKMKETSALNFGKNMLGGANSLNLDAKSQAAFDALIEAFELLLGEKPNMVISWIRNLSNNSPEVKQKVEEILSSHDIESLKDIIPAARVAGQKISRSISKGLGDLDTSSSDVVSINSSDAIS